MALPLGGAEGQCSAVVGIGVVMGAVKSITTLLCGTDRRMTVLMCTVGLNPTPVALAVFCCTPSPTRVMLVCSTSSAQVGNRIKEVLTPLQPGTRFDVHVVGAGVSWRSTYDELSNLAPHERYRLDYTGGTTSMSMAAVKIHLERHEPDGGASLRTYVDEQTGTSVTDDGSSAALDTGSVSIELLAELHNITHRPRAVLTGPVHGIEGQDDRRRFIDGIENTLHAWQDLQAQRTPAERRAQVGNLPQARRIAEDWSAEWDRIGLREQFSSLRPPPEATYSKVAGSFLEWISLAAAVACTGWDEIVFNGVNQEDGDEKASEFDVIVRRGHRLVCIETKTQVNEARDGIGHRMSTAHGTFGGATRVHIHCLPAPSADPEQNKKIYDPLQDFGEEIDRGKRHIPELQRIHLLHTYSQVEAPGELNPPDHVHPVAAMIARLNADLPAPSTAGGHTHSAGAPPRAGGTVRRGTVMTALGGSDLLTTLIVDNDPGRTVMVAGPRTTVRHALRRGLRFTSAETTDLGAVGTWEAAWSNMPEAVVVTASKKSAGAGLLRYAHESGAAIEHLLPRGQRELGNSAIQELGVAPRWDYLLDACGYLRHHSGQPWGEQTHTLHDLLTLREVVNRWCTVPGVAVYVSRDLRQRLVAPVVITYAFLAFAVTAPFGGKKPDFPLARSFVAAQATILDARFGSSVRVWVAMSGRVHRQWSATPRPDWARQWDRMQMLSGMDEEHLSAPPWTLDELDTAIAAFLGIP